MSETTTYHIVGAAKTGYNLFKFMSQQGLNVFLYAADNDYARNKKGVEPISDFLGLSLDSDKDRLIVASETAFNLLESKYKAFLPTHYYLRNKLNLHEIASEIGVLSIPSLNANEIDKFPVALKPKESMAGKVPFKFKRIDDLTALKASNEFLADCLIQPYFDDSYKEYTIGGYFDGCYKSLISADEVNYYPKGISAFVINKTKENKSVIKQVASYLNDISFTGFIEMEFKVKGDDWYIMDVNPRPWGYFYFYLDGLRNFKDVLLYGQPVELQMKNQWVNPIRLALANLQGRFSNPSIKDLLNGNTCFEPLL